MDYEYPKFIVLNQKEESISIQKVNKEFAPLDWQEIKRWDIINNLLLN